MLASSNKNEFQESAIEVLKICFEFVPGSVSYNFEVGIIKKFNKANKTTFLESVRIINIKINH